MQTCKGKTRTGAACRAPAGAGGLCFFHANPDSAKTLGQIGGRNNRRSVVDVEVPDNMTAADVSKVTAQAIRFLLSGDLRAREACALAQLCETIGGLWPLKKRRNPTLALSPQSRTRRGSRTPAMDRAKKKGSHSSYGD